MSLGSVNTAQPPLYQFHLNYFFQRFPSRLQSKAIARGLSVSVFFFFKRPLPLVAYMI